VPALFTYCLISADRILNESTDLPNPLPLVGTDVGCNADTEIGVIGRALTVEQAEANPLPHFEPMSPDDARWACLPY